MSRWQVLGSLAVACALFAPAVAQEHPEHPQKKQITIDDVAAFIEADVKKKTAAADGWMTLRDSEAGVERKFRLDKVHRERLAKTAPKTYFVCADFKTPDGQVFDLDFWVKETGSGLEVTETMIHKEDGVARYNWVEEGGVWKRKPV